MASRWRLAGMRAPRRKRRHAAPTELGGSLADTVSIDMALLTELSTLLVGRISHENGLDLLKNRLEWTARRPRVARTARANGPNSQSFSAKEKPRQSPLMKK